MSGLKNWRSSTSSGPSQQAPISDTVKRLLAENRELDSRLTAAKKTVKDVKKSLSNIQLESSLIDHQLAVIVSESRLREEIKELKMKKILSEECTTVEWETKKNQAEMIFEKEEKTFEIHYERMRKSQERIESLCENERNEGEADGMAKAKESELKRVESLRDEIRWIYESKEFSEDVDKLRRDVMILKKRNAAILLRLTKKAQHLEEHLCLRKRGV